MEYSVVRSAEGGEAFCQAVKALLLEGWKPHGGIAISHATYTDRDGDTVSTEVWLQAMTRRGSAYE